MSAVLEIGRLPNLIVAGVSKAGTTSLFHYLGQHPDIGTSDAKELRYFTPLRYGQPLQPLETYTAHFSGCQSTRYAVEATPGYFYGGLPLAKGLAATCPDARIVVSLRSPAERCRSWFGFVKSRLRIPKEMTFEEYVDRCEELHRLGVDDLVDNQPFWGLGGGCYARWLDAWTETFGDRFKVLFFEDLVADPATVVRSLCEWLDLDDGPVQGFSFGVDNQTRQYRYRALQQAAVQVNRRSESFFHRHQHVKQALRRGYFRVNQAPGQEPMTPDLRRRLTQFFAPHDASLSKQLVELGLRLPAGWSP